MPFQLMFYVSTNNLYGLLLFLYLKGKQNKYICFFTRITMMIDIQFES